MKTSLAAIALLCTFGHTLAQNIVKELKPNSVYALDLTADAAAKFDKDRKLFDAVAKKINDEGIKAEDLTAEEQRVWNETDETMGDYWDIIGGGCSWYCGGGPDKVTASSELKAQGTNTYQGTNAHDLSYKTAWVEGVAGYGVGESLTYSFSPESPRITDVIVVNGYVKSEKAYLENSRVKKLKMYVNDKPYGILLLEDRRSQQTFKFEPIGNGKRDDFEVLKREPAWSLKFEIMDVYKGSKYDDVVITEIYFSGLDVH